MVQYSWNRRIMLTLTYMAILANLLLPDVHCYEYQRLPSLLEIDNCERKINHAGRYRLWGNVRPWEGSFIRYCSLKIHSPIGTKIRITFGGNSPPHINSCNPKSAISILDGWEVRQPLKRQLSYLPHHLRNTGLLVCPSPDPPAGLEFESSYNLAEIIYILQTDEQFVVNVQFEETLQDCYTYISENDMDKELTMRAKPGETCIWRLPGAVLLTVLHAECDAASTAFVMVGEERQTMYPLTDLCSTRAGDRRTLPCKFSTVVIKSPDRQSSVKFRLQRATFYQTLKLSKYCS